MRTIKFRAWTGEKMLYPEDKDKSFSKLWYRPMSALVGDGNDYKWMQYTGLKDKNGKEIYEGDITKIRTTREGFKPEYRHEEVKLVREELTHDQSGMIGYYTYPHEDGEVVGNIYENKELLKGGD